MLKGQLMCGEEAEDCVGPPRYCCWGPTVMTGVVDVPGATEVAASSWNPTSWLVTRVSDRVYGGDQNLGK